VGKIIHLELAELFLRRERLLFHAQVPGFQVEEELRRGTLVEILEDTPPPSAPVSLLYPRSAALVSARARVSRLGGAGVRGA
jgi:DNA-binding transcriptional LysR family regulator